ncbi:hypothetical protein CSB45_04210 [candidate division KSB3 bacterium]|uniref:Co-chaperone DjlA N-terminal domain-containing protein n=1 Tax=candidate division KSB3 bacterium TaxID=2044937 RepID=A0A2G6E927_9BACT|nr:MAG: hypothetical protein CSB45_04210 [candidate division KSB3 bacterium]
MENIDLLHSVVSMLVADGQLPPQESEFLKGLCRRLNLSDAVLEDVFGKFEQGDAYVYLPQDEDERKQLLNYLIQAIVADGKVAPQERQLLEAVTRRLGISQNDFQDMLNVLLCTDSEDTTE